MRIPMKCRSDEYVETIKCTSTYSDLKEGNIFTNMLRVLDKTFRNFIATRIQSKLIMYRDDSSRI